MCGSEHPVTRVERVNNRQNGLAGFDRGAGFVRDAAELSRDRSGDEETLLNARLAFLIHCGLKFAGCNQSGFDRDRARPEPANDGAHHQQGEPDGQPFA